MSQNSFSDLTIDKQIIKSLDVLGYTEPTQVQKEVIPYLLGKQDVIVKSQTGSGKTGAFGIPLCDIVEWEERAPQALVLTPTRELATQIKEEIFNIGRYKRIKVESIFGKSSFEGQAKSLKQRTHIVVATPGRLLDHIDQGTIDLSRVQTVVIDEADEMFAMGFVEQIEEVLDCLPEDRTTALFSATMPDEIKRLSEFYLNRPKFVEVEAKNLVQDRILQQFITVDKEDKLETLKDVLVVENPDSSIIFCNMKATVDGIESSLGKMGVKVTKLHGGMEQRDRTQVIKDFKRGYFRYLVATDVAARGLDIADIAMVINYDIPDNPETYVHRIGRTARFENHGKAVSFVCQHDGRRFDEIMTAQNHDIQEIKRASASLVRDRQLAFSNKQQRKPQLRKEKGFDFKEDIMKIHINAGRKTKMRAGDIVGTLCNIDGMTADDIGVISLLDISTFVEILNGKGPMVLKTLQTMPIKGRIRHVNKANESTYERDIKQFKK
ncbi:MAG: DEAD/DEAH box helicase [Vagococcus sp.]